MIQISNRHPGAGTARTGMARAWPHGRGARLAEMLLIAGLLGCADGSTPDCSEPPAAQDPPVGSNGIAADVGGCRGTLWVADLYGGELLRFDPDSGLVVERYGRNEGLDPPDDLVVLGDGRLVSTSPFGRTVSVTERGGRSTVLARFDRGPNPIALEPGGEAVVVGFEAKPPTTIERVPLDGGPATTLASGLPALNGFDFGPDGFLYAPTGGVAGIFGGGGIAKIDTRSGEWSQLPLAFDEPGKTGLDFAVGIAFGPDRALYALQGISPAVYRVEVATGRATLVALIPTAVGDNLAFGSAGRLFVSTFIQPRLIEVLAGGSAIERPIGG